VTVDTENEPKINILRAEARKKGNLIVIALDMYGNPVDMAQGHGSLICDQNFDCEDKAYNAAVKAVMTCQDRYFRSKSYPLFTTAQYKVGQKVWAVAVSECGDGNFPLIPDKDDMQWHLAKIVGYNCDAPNDDEAIYKLKFDNDPDNEHHRSFQDIRPWQAVSSPGAARSSSPQGAGFHTPRE